MGKKKGTNDQAIEKDIKTLENKVQLDFDTPLNPRYSVGIDVDLTNPTSSSAFYEGGSIDAHRQVQQANEFFAEDEIAQQRDNL